MATFKQATKWLRAGKKVRRPMWILNSFWTLGKDESIEFSDGSKANVHLDQLNATDWEIFKENFVLDTILTSLKCIKEEVDSFSCIGTYTEDQYDCAIQKIKDLVKEAGL